MGDVFAELGKECGIKQDPANHLDRLMDYAKNLELGNGYVAINKIRNNSVHANQDVKLNAFLLEAWVSSQWLIEVIILKQLGYGGEFIDRRSAKFENEKSCFLGLF